MDKINLDINQHIAKIVINNPEKNNSFDNNIIKEFTKILNKLKSNQDVTIIILEAEGKYFSSGADLAWMQETINYSREENYTDSLELAQMLHLLYTMPQVTIAKVNGPAFGGGVGLVACCDIAIAAKNTTFCFSEVKLGLVPAIISPYIIRTIGLKQAKRYFVTAEIISAQKALDIELITEVVELDNLDKVVDDYVEKISKNSSFAVRNCKDLLKYINNKELNLELLSYTAHKIANLRVSPDAQDRLKKFLKIDKE